jgi:hypothetical protein
MSVSRMLGSWFLFLRAWRVLAVERGSTSLLASLEEN